MNIFINRLTLTSKRHIKVQVRFNYFVRRKLLCAWNGNKNMRDLKLPVK